MSTLDSVQQLVKALEAGSYDAAPSTLVQGAALQIEDLSSVMNNVTFEDRHIKLQKDISVEPCKSTLAQFDRQLGYGQFGGSAQIEGGVGQENISDFVRITVPMCYYSEVRRATVVANMVATVDGKKADERCAQDAAKRLAGDIEFDVGRGMDDFSNAGVFDGNPLAVSIMPNMHGLSMQVRQSDVQANAKDNAFSEYGSDDSVVLSVGTTLTQGKIEDASTRSAMNFGDADQLLIDPVSLGEYNKLAYNKERINLAGSPQESHGASLRKQWVAGGTVSLEASNFLRGKCKPARTRASAPGQVTIAVTQPGAAVGAPFTAAEVYKFYVTAVNEVGESVPSAVTSFTVGGGDTGKAMVCTITDGTGTIRHFNVYRSLAGGTAASAKFIGRVAKANAGTTAFTDLGNKLPGFVTGLLVQKDTMALKELAPYSRLKLAVTDLSTPEAHFRFTSLAVFQPRKNVILDNIKGSI
jgi:hypothetical protein